MQPSILKEPSLNRGERRKRSFAKFVQRLKDAKRIYHRWVHVNPDSFEEKTQKILKNKQCNEKRRYKREKDVQNWKRNANADLPQKDEM